MNPIYITIIVFTSELIWDYVERRDTGKVNHNRGFLIRVIAFALVLALTQYGAFFFFGFYVAFYNPAIGLAWKLGGWLPSKYTFEKALFYIGRTSWVDQITWKIFGNKTPRLALLTYVFIGAILMSTYFWPEQWFAL